MNPTDLADVSGDTYTYLMNGQAPNGNWTGIFKPGEKLRLRFINGSALSYFWNRSYGKTADLAAMKEKRPTRLDLLQVFGCGSDSVFAMP